ncbi:hypothetical protein [Fredinandcohnia sp. 179-A 10B2 NHS]
MSDKNDQADKGLNQLLEIINAKGDTGELNKIVERSNKEPIQRNKDTRN